MGILEMSLDVCWSVFFVIFSMMDSRVLYMGFNKKQPSLENNKIRNQYVSITALHIEILCALRAKYYALGARNDIRTVPT